MSEYVLYCFAQSGNAYKPALALQLANADWEPRFVDYFGGETRSPEYRKSLSPRTTQLFPTGPGMGAAITSSVPARSARR